MESGTLTSIKHFWLEQEPVYKQTCCVHMEQ